jgi:hypothetical protein
LIQTLQAKLWTVSAIIEALEKWRRAGEAAAILRAGLATKGTYRTISLRLARLTFLITSKLIIGNASITTEGA